MKFFGQTHEEQRAWKQCFALFPTCVGQDIATGAKVVVWFEFYEVRWTGGYNYGFPGIATSRKMERRLPDRQDLWSYEF